MTSSHAVPPLSDIERYRSEAHHVAGDALKLPGYPLLGRLIYDELTFRAGLHWGINPKRMRALLDETRNLLVLLRTTDTAA